MEDQTYIMLAAAALLSGLLGFAIRSRRTKSSPTKLAASKLTRLARTDQAMLLVTKAGLIDWVNEGFCRLSGFNATDVLGKTILEVLLDNLPNPKAAQQIQCGLSSGNTFSVELLCAHAEGRRYWLSLHITPLRDFRKKVSGFVAIGADVTSRKQVEDDLLRVSRRNDSLLEVLGEGIFILDSLGNITFLNPTASKMTGWQQAEIIGQPVSALVHQLKIGQICSDQKDLFLSSAMQQGTVLAGEINLFRRKDGSVFAVDYSTSSIRENTAAPSAMVLFRDVTEHQRAETARMWQERQNAFRAEVMSIIAGGESLRHTLQKCAQALVEHLHGEFARIWLLNEAEQTLELQAGAGACAQLEGNQNAVRVGESEVGLIALNKESSRIEDLASHSVSENRDWLRHEQLVSFAGTPILSEGKLIGVMGIYSKTVLPRDCVPMMEGVGENLARAIAQKALQEKLVEQAALLDKSQDAIVVMDLSHRVTFWNKSAERLYGWTARDVMGKEVGELIYRDGAYFGRASETVVALGEWKGECCQVNKGDGTVIVDSQWTLIHDDAGKPKSILMVNTDVTDKKKIQAQFLRTQRMESIGTLAGGIAHDLNNVLAPILMSSEILRQKASDEQGKRLLSIIEESAKRGADMVKQVLTFARGVEGERVLLQTRHLIKEVVKIIGETLPKTMQVRTRLAEDLWPILGDTTQLHQVLVNLVVNARDAMPNGGALTLSAENFSIEPGAIPKQAGQLAQGDATEIKPGPYVLLKVSDTGTGMTPEVLDKIFEPFFTTKEMGKGTGLGLATVLGIVKSHSGFVQVQTEVDKGTTFLIYLPAMVSAPEESGSPESQKILKGNGELILAVDDEISVLTMVKETLEYYGYRVITAKDGTEAVAAFTAQHDEIKGVITDMLMPYMDGPATIRVLRKLNPNTRILACSGLMDSERARDATGLENLMVLMKPFTSEKLMSSVYSLLHENN
jgi:PAS domain S-box-containing protein